MQSWFSFQGKQIGKFGLEYVPQASDYYVYKPTKHKVHETSFDGHDGGYYYGHTAQVKRFTLRCCFEEKNITQGFLNKIQTFFRIGKSGKLIFSQRPWCYYNATLTNVDFSNVLNYSAGFVTFTFDAYYPYARTDYYTYDSSTEFSDNIKANTNMLSANQMPTRIAVTNNGSMTAENMFLLYTGGNVDASVAIEIAGRCDGVVSIENLTNGTACRFANLTKENTTNAGKYVVCDALSGKTFITDGVHAEVDNEKHYEGFITLAANDYIKRNIRISTTAGSNVITSTEKIFEPDDEGKYIWLSNRWNNINTVLSDDKLVIDAVSDSNYNTTADIVMMNEIFVSSNMSFDLTKLNFVYKATFD